MAITKTRSVFRLEVHNPDFPDADPTTNDAHPWMSGMYEHTFDDPDDNDLPVVSHKEFRFFKFVTDGGDATDLTGEDDLIVTVGTAIWAE